MAEHAAGNNVDPSKITLGEFLDRWDIDYAAVNVSAKTRERYRQIVKNQIKPHLGQVQLQKLRPVHLADLYAKLLKADLAPRMVKHVHRLLHRALGHAGTWGMVQQNVAALAEPPKVEVEEVVTLTPEQAGQLLRHVQGRSLRPILALALATGARRSELLALRRRISAPRPPRSVLNGPLSRPKLGCDSSRPRRNTVAE